MKVWSICALVSVTVTDIWTKFGTEHKYHTNNTPEWPNLHKLKIQDGCGRHLEFRKIVNNSGLDKDISTKFCEDASRPCGDDRVTKGRNRKLIPVTSSNERLKHKCVDLSYYNIIWTKFGKDLKFHTVYTLEWSNSQPQNARCRLPPFWIFRLCEIKKMLVVPDWMKIYASNFTE